MTLDVFGFHVEPLKGGKSRPQKPLRAPRYRLLSIALTFSWSVHRILLAADGGGYIGMDLSEIPPKVYVETLETIVGVELPKWLDNITTLQKSLG